MSGGAIASMVLTVLACLLAFVGFIELTPATFGVGFIGEACFLAILARLAQASARRP